MAKKVHSQKTVNGKDGKKYVGFKRKNSINVKVSRTAKDQLISVATYDLKTKTWNDCNHKCFLPTHVKEFFETFFA
jgi:hypothetical protein